MCHPPLICLVMYSHLISSWKEISVLSLLVMVILSLLNTQMDYSENLFFMAYVLMNIEFMDKDIEAALFGTCGTDTGDFEELADDFVIEVGLLKTLKAPNLTINYL